MLTAEGCSLQGERHETNQDNFAISLQEENGIVLIADGMGGHRAGDTASKMAIDLVLEHCKENEPESVGQAISVANRAIYDKGRSEEAYAGMGTTIVMCMVRENVGYIAHVGDSRAYLLHGEELTQLTRDHSLVEELMQHGEISEEEARVHPMKNIITMALGVEEEITPTFSETVFRDGDSLLLCSDGFSNVVSEDVIKETLLRQPPSKSVPFLCEEAKRCGSTDDITVIVLQKSK